MTTPTTGREAGRDDGRPPSFAAVDLGATSGRVIVGSVVGEPGAERIDLVEVARFPNEPVRHGDRLVWDLPALWDGVVHGLAEAAARFGPLAGIGVDSWAVDYALVDDSGAVLSPPVHYRDPRTEGMADRADALVPPERRYAVTGLQRQPFTTAHQLLAEDGDLLEAAHRLLLVPDLLGARLTGQVRAEITNASTTGLLDARRRTWSAELVDGLGLPRRLLPDLIEPGERLGRVRAEHGVLAGTPVWTVGSHDTASAVVAVPLGAGASVGDGVAAYVSCGTWSLVGLELGEPVLTEASREANLTNEAGVDGTVRYLANVMGLWVLSETLRTWAARGTEVALADALAAAREVPLRRTLIDIDDASLLPPGDMPARLTQLARAAGQPVPESVGEVVRCILDSLALAYRRSVRTAARLAGVEVTVVHIVGGGVHNSDLCHLTADATGLPVVAGPAEGAALGNVLVQARAAGVLAGDWTRCDASSRRPAS
ncbi:rhamnulokinase [Serinibacter arcticus]|uniref:Rhamnulokinase n=1 Tax=Serinibacter arcticus TaxID=1655435 RepID=A0A2U1ZY12_9MICO|nr:rhamnulokinase family protein [Serinibacter arcticus]PWD51878.1 rhamnulokinase [Serinibacter arcticus]